MTKFVAAVSTATENRAQSRQEGDAGKDAPIGKKMLQAFVRLGTGVARWSAPEVALEQRDEKGFTLIELLTVIAIVGVLAAIAIPQFMLYRQHAFDGLAQSDLRNVVTAEEAYFSANGTYVSCTSASNCQSILHGYTKSDNGVQLAVSATTTTYVGTSKHVQGAGGIWKFDSEGGRFIYLE